MKLMYAIKYLDIRLMSTCVLLYNINIDQFRQLCIGIKSCARVYIHVLAGVHAYINRELWMVILRLWEKMICSHAPL